MNHSSSFQNINVDIDSLPKLSEVNLSPLQRDYLKVILISQAIFWGILSILLIIFNPFSRIEEIEHLSWLFWSLWILIVLLSFFVALRGFSVRAYGLRSHDVYYREGLLWKSETVIPFNRIQHCEVKQGPVDRLFSLAQLKIFTAGGSASDLSIPGLSHEKANSIRHFILQKATAIDEEE